MGILISWEHCEICSEPRMGISKTTQVAAIAIDKATITEIKAAIPLSFQSSLTMLVVQ